MIEQIARLPDEIARIIEKDNPSGRYEIELVVASPERWKEQLDAAFKRALQFLDMQ